MKRFVFTLLAWAVLHSAASAQVLQPSPQSINAVSSAITDCVSLNCATWSLPNTTPSFTAQLTGTMTSLTLTAEGTADGQTWFSVFVTKLSTGVLSTTTTSTGQYAVLNTGLVGFRFRCTTYASGGANVTLTRGASSSALRLVDLSNVSGTLAAINGGTGISSYAVGDLLYADTTTTLAKRAAVAVGQVLASAGTSTAPVYTGTPLLTAGTGTQTYHAGGTLYSESISVGNGADNNFVKTGTYAIPASTLTTNQDMLEVDMVYLQSAEATDSRTYVCNYGFTSWAGDATGFTGGVNLMSNATTSASVNIHVRSYIKRVAAGTINYWSESLVGTSYQNTVWQTSSALTVTDAQNIACEARNTNGTPAADAITLKEFSVRYVPYR